MKIQLDTDKKTIKLEDDVVLSKLIDTLESLLPNGKWKEFELQTHTTITHWNQPYIIRETVRPSPWEQPWITWYTAKDNTMQYAGDNADYSLKSGVYNIEA